MMKLILSLTLIWTLSSTAEALQCMLDDSGTKIANCNLCATLASREFRNGKTTDTVLRMCAPPLSSVGTKISTFNFGYWIRYEYVRVCGTDRCNNEVIPKPRPQNINGMFCYTCNDETSTRCKNPLMCEGDQTRCIGETKEKPGASPNIVGCITPNKCKDFATDPSTHSGNFTGPKCCEGNFCNSAWSVRLNVVTLLFALTTLIFSLF